MPSLSILLFRFLSLLSLSYIIIYCSNPNKPILVDLLVSLKLADILEK